MPIKDPEKLKEARKRADEKRKDTRTRMWTFVLYPESAPADWRDQIDDYHMQWIESPLHDADMNADGTPKKPHIHILLLYESHKTYEQVLEVTQKVNATVPQKCHAARGLVRYMAHLDNPEKAQYDRALIRGHGGADVGEYLKLSSSESMELQKEIIRFVIDNDLTEYVDLVTYALENRQDWFEELTCRSFNAVQIIKSRRHCGRKPINPITGEFYGEQSPSEEQ